MTMVKHDSGMLGIGYRSVNNKSKKNMSDNRIEHLYSLLTNHRTENFTCPEGDLNPSNIYGTSGKSRWVDTVVYREA